MRGCLTFIVAPDEGPTLESQVDAALQPGFPTVVIDPGHGGNDDGARGNGLVEKDLTLDVAFRVEKAAQAIQLSRPSSRGATTPSSRSRSARPSPTASTTRSSSASISTTPATARSTGVETFYASEKVPPEAAWTWIGFFNKPEPAPADNGEDARRLHPGRARHAHRCRQSRHQGARLYVVRHTRCPAVLVEGGFINNPLEAQLISNGEYRDRLAQAIAEGVMSYQKNRARSPRTPPPKLAQAATLNVRARSLRPESHPR